MATARRGCDCLGDNIVWSDNDNIVWSDADNIVWSDSILGLVGLE